MAVALNKNRKRDSKILIILILAAVLFTKPMFPLAGGVHTLLDFLGYFLIALCACGRVYATAFLGGHKNEMLIDYGSFSMCRNPLYFFSLSGFTGICLMTGHLVIILIAPVLFYAIYYFLIGREEVFLREKFGAAFDEYTQRVPRLFPRLSLYHAPEEVQMRPKYLARAFRDNLWWFAAFPLFELLEYVQQQEVIPAFFVLP